MPHDLSYIFPIESNDGVILKDAAGEDETKMTSNSYTTLYPLNDSNGNDSNKQENPKSSEFLSSQELSTLLHLDDEFGNGSLGGVVIKNLLGVSNTAGLLF